MSDRERDPKVSFRLPEAMRDAVDDLAERFDVPRSALFRRFTSFGLESNAEALAVEAEISKLRQEIIDYGSPIDDAGGFSGRVRSDFEKRFRNGYDAKWLEAKAENYRREARMLEEKVPEHPDAPTVEDGELVDEVDRVLRDALEALALSDWGDRYSNSFEKFTGVESGKDGRRFALVLTRNALEMDRDMEPLASSLDTERRVRSDDLPELASEELPEGVSRDDVARVARDLADSGVSPDMVDEDPTEFDPYGWGGEDVEHVEADVAEATDELPDPETDGGAISVRSDGGDHQALQTFGDADESTTEVASDSSESESEVADDDPTPTDDGGEIDDTEPTDMDQSEPLTIETTSNDDMSTRDDLLSYALDRFETMGTGPKVQQIVRAGFGPGNFGVKDYNRAVEKRDLDVDSIINEALSAVGVDGDADDGGKADA